MDPEIQRIIEDIQEELRELTQTMRSLGSVMSAIGDLELKAFGKAAGRSTRELDSFGDSLREGQKQVKEFTGIVDANGNVIRDEAKARREATEEAKKAAEEDRRKRTEDFVYRRNQRSAFRDLAAELSTTGGVTARLQESLIKQVGTNTAYQAGVLLLTASLRGLGQAVTSFASDLHQGRRGAEVSARAFSGLAKEVGDAAQGVGLALSALSLLGMFVPQLRIFGFTINLANKGLALLAGALALLGIGTKAAAEFNEKAAKQNDQLFKGYNDLSKAALGMTGGLDGVMEVLQLSGASVAELEAFSNQLASNAQRLAFLGITTGEATRRFAEVAGGLRKGGLGKELELLGIQSEEQRDAVLSYMSLQARLGRMEIKNTDTLVQSSAKFAKELDLMAQLTGTTRKEQMEIRERQMTDERYRSAIAAAKARGDTAEIDRLERAGKLAAAVEAAGDKAGATGILQIAAGRGALTTPEAVAAEMTYGVNQVLNGQTSVEDALTKMVEQGRITQQQMADVNAMIGTVQGYQVNVVDLANVIDRIGPAIDRARELGISVADVLKAEQEQRKQGDKSLKDNVEASRSQQNAAMIMDSVLRTFNYSAGLNKAASETFASAVNTFATTVGSRPVAGGLLDGVGTTPAGAKTPASLAPVQEAAAQAAKVVADEKIKELVVVNDSVRTAEQELAALKKSKASQEEIAKAKTKVDELVKQQETAEKAERDAAYEARQKALEAKNARRRARAEQNQAQIAAPGATSDYVSRVAQLESGGRNIPNQARAGQTATSASGLYQITKGTFDSLAANAPPGSPLRGKTFADMQKDTGLQTEAMRQLTESNANLLSRRGLSTSDAAKYMSHMLGFPTAARVLEAPGGTPLSKLVPKDYLEKNNLTSFRTAAELRQHFSNITGGQGYQRGGIARGPDAGHLQLLHGIEAIVPLPDGRSIPVQLSGPIQKLVSALGNLDLPSAAAPRSTEAPISRMLETTSQRQMDLMAAQLSKLDEVVTVMRNQLTTSNRILQVSQN